MCAHTQQPVRQAAVTVQRRPNRRDLASMCTGQATRLHACRPIIRRHGGTTASSDLVRVPAVRWRCLLRWRRRLLLQESMPKPSHPVHNERPAGQQGTRAGDRGCTANDGIIDASRRLATMVLRSLSLMDRGACMGARTRRLHGRRDEVHGAPAGRPWPRTGRLWVQALPTAIVYRKGCIQGCGE